MIQKVCKTCSATFTRPNRLGLKLWNKRLFCTRLCADKARKGVLKSEWVVKECRNCYNNFSVSPHRKETALYCTMLCLNRSKVGERAAHWKGGIGKKCPICGMKKNVVSKMCVCCRKKNTLIGELNPAWKGGVNAINRGIRDSVEYSQWRKHVFARDDYTCQACGIRGVELHADHELPFAEFPDLRLEILNGRTLCKKCHTKLPRITHHVSYLQLTGILTPYKQHI